MNTILRAFQSASRKKTKSSLDEHIEEGHLLIGLTSSGLHSNGFSLVRKVLLDDGGLDLDTVYEPFARPLGEELLEPTRIYVKLGAQGGEKR